MEKYTNDLKIFTYDLKIFTSYYRYDRTYNGLKKSDNKIVFLFPKRCKNRI